MGSQAKFGLSVRKPGSEDVGSQSKFGRCCWEEAPGYSPQGGKGQEFDSWLEHSWGIFPDRHTEFEAHDNAFRNSKPPDGVTGCTRMGVVISSELARTRVVDDVLLRFEIPLVKSSVDSSVFHLARFVMVPKTRYVGKLVFGSLSSIDGSSSLAPSDSSEDSPIRCCGSIPNWSFFIPNWVSGIISKAHTIRAGFGFGVELIGRFHNIGFGFGSLIWGEISVVKLGRLGRVLGIGPSLRRVGRNRPKYSGLVKFGQNSVKIGQNLVKTRDNSGNSGQLGQLGYHKQWVYL
ncbi:hypothetical protein LXL04_019213 [Taraxacum kok-saghyz]